MGIPIAWKFKVLDWAITGILKLTPTKKDDELYQSFKNGLTNTLKKIPDELLELGKTGK